METNTPNQLRIARAKVGADPLTFQKMEQRRV
jgi:hypothetical protein